MQWNESMDRRLRETAAVFIDPTRIWAFLSLAELEPVAAHLRASRYVVFQAITALACSARYPAIMAAIPFVDKHADAKVYAAIGASGYLDTFAIAAALRDDDVPATRARLLQLQGCADYVTLAWAARVDALVLFLPPGTAIVGPVG